MKPVFKTLSPYIICFITLLLIIFYYHIDKHLKGAIFVSLTTLIPIGITIILIYFLKGLCAMIMDRSRISLTSIIPTLLCLLSLYYTFFSPYRLSSEVIESNVVIRACYEGTQNQATLKFRKDKSFELHWTGVFFSDMWYTGTWEQNGTVLYLKYETEKSSRLGDTLVIKDGYLHKISQLSMEKTRPMFYLGYCRHEN
ncbi:hypothetical protein [Chitinophaga sp. S165]|uniref:hypothetical protein n=1 Tax=Chitinophaga sp. S165 TaxID=2135462 RepID=UPI000D70B0C2|nr:hypothetical protein [Chitinophaga sp. S165]PWV56390.1 hypothetical protein C7475_101905 [Chitinophaga sp. S165]